MAIILDCYTDEPAGLGVPPYLGTYPRYLAGFLKSQGEEVVYLTIDDLRWLKSGKPKDNPKPSQKTNIFIYNRTKNDPELLFSAKKIYVVLGVHVPGKYLTAMPGTLHEVSKLLNGVHGEKILTGPAFFGTSLQGGKTQEKLPEGMFVSMDPLRFSFDNIGKYSVLGADIICQIPDIRMVEIETSRGCPRKCSFCTEPIKNVMEYRKHEDILTEIKTLYDLGARHFRLGKQSDFYITKQPVELLKSIRESCPDIKVLHIDNVNPQMVLGKRGREITEAIVKYCTSGNIAAFGVESFDPEVVKQNNLVTTPEQAYEAVKIINEIGSERENGLPKFLPGINILFGLRGETKQSNEHNMKWLKRMLDEDLLLRRINIRQVNLYKGTDLKEKGGAMIGKNKKHYFKWRKQIRQEIDLPMLQKVFPKGTIISGVWTEMYDGNTTFARQFGTYPIIFGIKGRLPLKQFITVKVTGHMLRSVQAEVVNEPHEKLPSAPASASPRGFRGDAGAGKPGLAPSGCL